MANKNKLTIEEWEEIGEKVKEMREQAFELIEILRPIPKTVWIKDFDKIVKCFDSLKNKLDDRVFKEHPNQPTQRLTNVFYGETKKK